MCRCCSSSSRGSVIWVLTVGPPLAGPRWPRGMLPSGGPRSQGTFGCGILVGSSALVPVLVAANLAQTGTWTRSIRLMSRGPLDNLGTLDVRRTASCRVVAGFVTPYRFFRRLREPSRPLSWVARSDLAYEASCRAYEASYRVPSDSPIPGKFLWGRLLRC